MADIKISQLSSIQVVNDADVFPIVSSSVTNKVSAEAFKEYTIGNTDNSELGEDVSAQIQTLTNRVQALDAISQRKILVIGNSYVYYGVARKLETLFKAYYENYESATGFLAYADTNKNFVQQIENTINDASIPHGEITDILFVSAMGDTRAYSANKSTFEANVGTAMQTILQDIASGYPNCKRIMLTLAETRDKPYFADNPYSSLFAVHKIFKRLCFKNGIDYLGWSGFNALCQSSYVQTDHYHPNDAGKIVIGEWLKNSYLGHGEYETLIDRRQVAFNYVDGAKVMCQVELLPDMCNIRLGNFTATSGSGISLTANSELMTTYDLSVPAPAPTQTFSMPVPVIRISGGVIDNMLFIGLENDGNGMIKFYNYYAPQNAATGATTLSFQGLTNISYIP